MTAHFLNDLRNSLGNHSSRPALFHRDVSLTFGDLDGLAQRGAAWLQGMGVQPGDRVLLFTPEKMPFLLATLGTLFAGGVPLPLNPRFTREEMRYFLQDSGARALIVGADQKAFAEGLASELPQPPAVLPAPSAAILPDARSHEPSVAANDPCLMLYSSGTTGWPKGVVHTHATTANGLQALADCWRMNREDVVVNVLPLFHIHGLAFATLMPWLVGGCVRIEDGFDPEKTGDVIGQGTVFMGVPTLYYRLKDRPGFRSAVRSWGRVRLFTCGSAPLRPEVLPELQEALGRPLVNRYGMTEAFVLTSLPLDGPWPLGSVGLPLNGVALRVTREDGTPTEVGEVGAVAVQGLNLFREYWKKPDATRAAFADGWFDTGDLGALDRAGYLTLVGRKNDLIITSGFNVYPLLVERILGECPGVKECAVFGLPDADRGERVAAAVVRSDPHLDEARLQSWWSERLVYYQQPRSVVFVDALPRNNMGKVLRRELRDQLHRP